MNSSAVGRRLARAGLVAALCLAAGLVGPPGARAGERFITLASTTSTENSGLLAHLLPLFARETGIEVRVVAVGTGQALRLARNGDADVLLVHHPPSEESFVAAGYGVARHPVMYNDFVLVGPAADPADVREAASAQDALARIAATRAAFLSRGDDSGTHKKELSLWVEAGVDPAVHSGAWYRETGSGMGATLNTASAMNAYTLTDRGTWLRFGNRGELEILLEGDPPLFNPYSVIVVDPERHPHVAADDAQTFADWLVSPAGQGAIAAFRIHREQAFFPNARPTPP